ncbi:hypothetical protein J6590_007820 [Homalodisca vitripennis]|nr:hypothetical protein J6590_007820 [Homalodisca vitripennis]
MQQSWPDILSTGPAPAFRVLLSGGIPNMTGRGPDGLLVGRSRLWTHRAYPDTRTEAKRPMPRATEVSTHARHAWL